MLCYYEFMSLLCDSIIKTHLLKWMRPVFISYINCLVCHKFRVFAVWLSAAYPSVVSCGCCHICCLSCRHIYLLFFLRVYLSIYLFQSFFYLITTKHGVVTYGNIDMSPNLFNQLSFIYLSKAFCPHHEEFMTSL